MLASACSCRDRAWMMQRATWIGTARPDVQHQRTQGLRGNSAIRRGGSRLGEFRVILARMDVLRISLDRVLVNRGSVCPLHRGVAGASLVRP
jgi:hypothetical protein